MKVKTDTITPQESPEKELLPKDVAREKLKKMMVEESKLVKGVFRCYENPGSVEKISVKKYPTPAEMLMKGQTGGVTPFEKYMRDGETYEIPLYVARFLNGVDATAEHINGKINSCAYAIHSFTWDRNNPNGPQSMVGPDGVPVPVPTRQEYKRRYGFESLEFNIG